jgi:CRP-like cAMP-binding protein
MAKKLKQDGGSAELVRKAFQLGELPVGVHAQEIASLFPNSGLFEYAADEHIIEQDDASKDVYLLCEGKVAIAKTFGSAGTTLATLNAGAVFGEMAFLNNGVRVATAAAQTKCKVLRMAAQDIEAVLKTNPPLGTQLKQMAARRVA